jgi:hypothetical protein
MDVKVGDKGTYSGGGVAEVVHITDKGFFATRAPSGCLVLHSPTDGKSYAPGLGRWDGAGEYTFIPDPPKPKTVRVRVWWDSEDERARTRRYTDADNKRGATIYPEVVIELPVKAANHDSDVSAGRYFVNLKDYAK